MNQQLTEKEYLLLELHNEESAGGLCKLLNSNGACNWTVCPKCRVDDFVHLEECKLLRPD